MLSSEASFYIVTGPPGSGKTSTLEAMGEIMTILPEFARRVLAEERKIGGRATGEQDPALFVERMLATATADYDQARALTLFDRGLPDLLAFCAYYDLSDARVRAQLDARPYASPVFFCPAWPEIYINDAERRLDFEGARAFGDLIRSAYLKIGYEIIDVPFDTPERRAEFIRGRIRA